MFVAYLLSSLGIFRFAFSKKRFSSPALSMFSGHTKWWKWNTYLYFCNNNKSHMETDIFRLAPVPIRSQSHNPLHIEHTSKFWPPFLLEAGQMRVWFRRPWDQSSLVRHTLQKHSNYFKNDETYDSSSSLWFGGGSPRPAECRSGGLWWSAVSAPSAPQWFCLLSDGRAPHA